MNRLFASAVAALATLPAAHAADVGVSVQISQPGVYGRIDIGRFPQPAVIVARPVLVAPPPVVAVAPQPVYLWVPPGHRKKWHKHCHQYGACGVPVYFVRDDWYERHVRHTGRDDDDEGHHRRHGKDKDKHRDKHKHKDKDD